MVDYVTSRLPNRRERRLARILRKIVCKDCDVACSDSTLLKVLSGSYVYLRAQFLLVLEDGKLAWKRLRGNVLDAMESVGMWVLVWLKIR